MQEQVYWTLVRLGYLVILLGLTWNWETRHRVRTIGQGVGKGGVKRQRHPHSPRDCPACSGTRQDNEDQRAARVRPWAEQKSKRGRPKTVETDGYSCNNPRCAYYNITDSALHALVGCGTHHGADDIAYFKCQACGRKVSSRWNTPMYDLKTKASRVAEVLTASSEGVDVAAAHRIFKHDERTIQGWLTRMARHSQRLHHRFFHHLVCQHLQLDELLTKLRGVKERAWVWVALDAQTKIIPVIHLGSRTAEDAQRFVHEVWQRLAPGAPPVFTSDGLWLYYYALTAHFGQWVPRIGKRWPVWQVDSCLLYGQLHKVKVGYRLKNLYTVAVCGSREQLRTALQAINLTGKIMTAYVERVNLTLREHLAPLSRRTWSLARDTHTLWSYLEWGRAYYHFCRFHDALRLPTQHPHRYRSRTPAMAAGLARRRWHVKDVLLMPLSPT